jgi:hypothetical protein
VLKNRAIRLSVVDRLAAMFAAPDAATGLSPFHVYYEPDFRNVQDGSFSPSFPWVYLLDAFLSPTPQRVDLQQPQVVVEVDSYESMPFELGNRSGRCIYMLIHVFGKNRGERDDIGGFIADYFGSAVDIKSYAATNHAGTVVDSALVDPLIKVNDIFTPRIEKASQIEVTTTLLGWTSVSLTIRPKL